MAGEVETDVYKVDTQQAEAAWLQLAKAVAANQEELEYLIKENVEFITRQERANNALRDASGRFASAASAADKLGKFTRDVNGYLRDAQGRFVNGTRAAELLEQGLIDAAEAAEILAREAEKAGKGTEEAGKKSKKAKGEVDDLAKSLKEDLADSLFSATARYELFKEAISAVGDFIIEGAEFNRQEANSIRVLANSYRLAGYDGEVMAAVVQEQASKMERLTGATAESTREINKMLLTTEMGPQLIQRTTRAAQNMAEVLGKDVVEVADALAEAYAEQEDSIDELNLVVGEAEFAAKGFVAILEKVESLSSGATTAVTEQQKALNEVSGAWRDFQSAIGGAANEMLAMMNASGSISKYLDAWSELLNGKTTKALWAQEDRQKKINKAIEDEIRLTMMVGEARKDLEESNPKFAFYQDQVRGVKFLEAELAKAEKARKRLQGIDVDVRHQPLVMDEMDIESDFPRRLRVQKELAKKELKETLAELAKAIKANEDLLKEDAKSTEEYAKFEVQIREANRQMREQEHAEMLALDRADQALFNEAMKEQRDRREEELRLQREQIDAHWEAVLEDMRGYASQFVETGVGMFSGFLTANSDFNNEINSRRADARAAELEDMDIARARAEVEKELMGEVSAARRVELNDRLKKLDEKNAATLEELGISRTKAEAEKELAAEERAANQQRIADFLGNLAEQAAVKAIFQTAEGFANLASYNYSAAAMNFAAAGQYAAVAVAAGGAAVVLSNTRGRTREEREQLEAMDRDAAERDAQARERANQAQARSDDASGGQLPGTQVNVYNIGIAGVTQVQQARELERIRKEYESLRTGKG